MNEISLNNSSLKLFYDGDCPLCRREISWLKNKVKNNSVEFLDIQNSELEIQKYGKSKSELMAQIHALRGESQWIVGMDAFRAVYKYTPFANLVFFTEIPGLKNIFDWSYKIFARNRLRLTGRQCEDNACE